MKGLEKWNGKSWGYCNCSTSEEVYWQILEGIPAPEEAGLRGSSIDDQE